MKAARNPLQLLTIAMFITIAGCGGDEMNHGDFDDGPATDDGTPDDTTGVDVGAEDTFVEPSACLPAWGTAGVVTVTPGVAQSYATVETTAMNQMDNTASPLPYMRTGALATGTGDCTTAGLLWMDPNLAGDSTKKLWYQDITTVGTKALQPEPELVIDGLSPATNNATLFYAAACMPIAMRPTSANYMEYRRSAEGTWNGVIVNPALDGTITGLSGFGGWQERDGTMVVIARASVDGAPKGVVGRRSIEPYSTWTFAKFDLPPSFTDLMALRQGPDGTVHALYTKTLYPCEGACDLNLYYGRMAPGGNWVEETVQESTWNDDGDAYAADPTMVLDSRGEPVVAATFLTHVATGSVSSSELRVFGRDDGEWCMETVATQVDGYRGADGTDMTGVAPFVTTDGTGRLHVVFQDMAQWHDGNNHANAVNGQIRYAVRAGKQWTLKTLFAQEEEGTGAPAAPLHGMLPTMLAVSPDGKTVYAAGAAFDWQTDSIYNSDYKDITFKATAVKADVALP